MAQIKKAKSKLIDKEKKSLMHLLSRPEYQETPYQARIATS
jgi:hypothetical protein